ncbi:hypothetical protein CAPTEDRAFT_209323 [Capitella teleta]|uniref:N-acetyltransferase domain-containing protein n=1 Tax=Capitella teleta TaxID=283909 RepID=R7UAZ4_CAPTE|nr:hypothetical protein CAPTEDRAFT_209323 [Capitella teleta]|eukprot:ELU00958.1 hypothetical protein CAPTEDRAFT_209323 [Capitella teleta]
MPAPLATVPWANMQLNRGPLDKSPVLRENKKHLTSQLKPNPNSQPCSQVELRNHHHDVFSRTTSTITERRGFPAIRKRSLTHVKQVPSTEQTRRDFRRIAKASTGKSFDADDGDRLFFIYDGPELVGVGSLRLAATQPRDHQEAFLSDRHHTVNFVFVKSHLKRRGYGADLLRAMLKHALNDRQALSVRVQSAARAVGFFEKHGFQCVGGPIYPLYGRIPLFSTLFNMQMTVNDTCYNSKPPL